MLSLALVALVHATPAPSVLTRPDGRIELAQGVLSAPYPGDLRDAALQFALARKAELGLGVGSTLALGQGFSTRLGASVHLEQRISDVPVYGATVIVTFDNERRVVRVSSSLASESGQGLVWNLTGAQALAAGAKQTEGALLKADRTPYGGYQRYVFPREGRLRAGYLVWVPTLQLRENWHLAIDAADGRVLFSENRVHFANEAKVYASSPLGLTGGVGVTPTIDVELGNFTADFDGGVLEGAHVHAWNCCPTAGCDLDAGAPSRRSVGQFQTFNGVLTYDVAICDRQHRATSDLLLNPNGNFVYAPVDPPTAPRPGLGSLADYDEFAEVHAYHHVNKVYDYLHGLSVGPLGTMRALMPFRTRDEQQGKVSAVWVNVSEPDFQAATNTATGIESNVLARVSNAMFVQREQMQAMSVPEYQFDTDALVIYQGNEGDFAYDGPVVWHEFGHGAIHATADWGYTVTIDSRSANVESQALHEANADVIAAITGNLSNIGAYVGPRTAAGTDGIRDLNNSFKCPDVLWGESHQDGQHYTGAIWEARSTLFQGSDEGKTFDAAFYAALVAFPKNVDFEKAATIISASVGMAFPSMSDAEAKMKAVFDARGVTNCSKVVDLTENLAPRPYYGIAGGTVAGLTMGTLVPGPTQFKIQAPRGIKSVTVTGPYFSGGGTTTARVRLLAKANLPITFTRNGAGLDNDADVTVTPTVAGGMMNGRADIAVPCGGEVYFTLANSSGRDRTLFNVTFQYEQADSCPEPPMPDPIVLDAPTGELGSPAPKGCGCGAPGALPFAVLALALVRRRRQS